MKARILVAGIGNLFLGDDGFGPEAVRRFAEAYPEHAAEDSAVRVVDYGIRGMHLAYDLLAGYESLVLVDAVPARGDPPGTLRVVEVTTEHLRAGEFDAHGMDPTAMLGSLDALGGRLPRTMVVGCVPATLDERIGLSAPVAAAIGPAVVLTANVVRRLLADLPHADGATGRPGPSESGTSAPMPEGGDVPCASASRVG